MRAIRRIILTVSLLLLVLIGGYAGIACYYTGGFTFGTWINGIYCTGKSVAEVNRELVGQTERMPCTIRFADGKTEQYLPQEGQITYDYTAKLQSILQKQDPKLWLLNVLHSAADPAETSMQPQITVSEKALQDTFYAMQEVQTAQQTDRHVRLVRTRAQGYFLENTKKNALNVQKAYFAVLDAVEQGRSEVDLQKSGCYEDLQLTPQEEQVMKQYEKLKAFLDFQLTYDMGDGKVVFGHAKLSYLLTTGISGTDLICSPDGGFIWDTAKVDHAVDELAQEYDTYKTDRQFRTTRGEIVTVKGGTYGNQLDRKKEKAYLRQALSAHKSELHEPAYLHKAYIRGKNDIGDTYIEIDLTNQKMYCYQKGDLIVETPIVTGNMMLHRDTPSGIFYIYYKQKNRILRGPGYASHVNYWMAVRKGVGIHDALWRDEFGGTIYQKHGSHGCINTPYDAMKLIYDQYEVGMPVILYW